MQIILKRILKIWGEGILSNLDCLGVRNTEYDNEPMGSLKEDKFLDYLSDYYGHMESCAPQS